MYRTIQSPASLTADTGTARPGLVSSTPMQPVLCSLGPSTPGNGQVTFVAFPGTNADMSTDISSPDSSSLYVAPGRLSAGGNRVADNASVDELISAARGDAFSA